MPPPMTKPRFMLSGGGTGGHIFPALAIADELKKRYPEAEFLFVGAYNRMEMERIPQAGYRIEGIWISGLQRKLSLQNLSFPFKVISSLWRCRKLIASFRPQVVIGTGGFASGPLLFAAAQKGLPCLIQEQNSYPGITNKILAARVQRICVAYPDMERFFPADKLRLTGNPLRNKLRETLPNAAEARSTLGLAPKKTSLLILGGSLGSARINQLIEKLLPRLQELQINLLWQCGKLYYQKLQSSAGLSEKGDFQLHPFLSDMNSAFAAADLVVSRAGANTLSELAAVGQAALLIPSPNVAEDHQNKNAQALARREAARVFDERESAEALFALLRELLEDEEQRRQLRQNISAMALPQAAEHIADEIEKLMAHANS